MNCAPSLRLHPERKRAKYIDHVVVCPPVAAPCNEQRDELLKNAELEGLEEALLADE